MDPKRRRLASSLGDFCVQVYRKSTEDDVCLMAGAISFDLLVAVVPLFLLIAGLWGYDYRSTYGNLTTLVVLFFWIYYASIVFLLSGEIALVHAMRKERGAKITRVSVS